MERGQETLWFGIPLLLFSLWGPALFSEESEDELEDEMEETEDVETPTANAPAAGDPTAVTPPANDFQASQVSEQEQPSEQAQAPAKPPPNKQAAITKALLTKFTNRDGSLVPIVLLSPINYANKELADLVTVAIQKSFARLGNFNLRQEKSPLSGLTLEQFRKVFARYRCDVVLVPILKQNRFELVLYDRRNPYRIVLHSEIIPAHLQRSLNETAATQLAQALVKRALQLYAKDQSFEMPREPTKPIVQSEIPRWMASQDTLKDINRELKSRFYVGASFGAAMTMGIEDSGWNSSIIAAHGAYRAMDDFYVEAAFAAFAYNAFVGSVKYFIQDKTKTVRFAPGVGYSFVTRRKSLASDAANTLGSGAQFVVPSLTLLIPIESLYVKAETQFFYNFQTGKSIFTFMPGLLLLF